MQKAIMVFKSLHGLVPGYLSDQFTNRNDETKYSLRDSENKLAVPLPRTHFLKNSFSYSGAVVWNSFRPTIYGKRDHFFLYKLTSCTLFNNFSNTAFMQSSFFLSFC